MIGDLIIGLLDPAETRTSTQAAAHALCTQQRPVNKRKEAGHVAHVLPAAGVAKMQRHTYLRQAIGYLPGTAAISLLLYRKFTKIGVGITEVLGFGYVRKKRPIKALQADRRFFEKRLGMGF